MRARTQLKFNFKCQFIPSDLVKARSLIIRREIIGNLYYSGFPKETPELKFRLVFFFFSFSHSLQFFN